MHTLIIDHLKSYYFKLLSDCLNEICDAYKLTLLNDITNQNISFYFLFIAFEILAKESKLKLSEKDVLR